MENRQNKLSDLRSDVVNELIEQVRSYYDDSHIFTAFDVFDSVMLPSTLIDAQTYGMDRIRHLAVYYDESVAALQRQWREAISMIVPDSMFESLQASKDPVTFWHYYLKTENQIVDWETKQELEKIIQISLIIYQPAS
ncbi:MAG: hypothetical protein GY861_11475 [bacterium]|nr:hypothetical protein [bacterium]